MIVDRIRQVVKIVVQVVSKNPGGRCVQKGSDRSRAAAFQSAFAPQVQGRVLRRAQRIDMNARAAPSLFTFEPFNRRV